MPHSTEQIEEPIPFLQSDATYKYDFRVYPQFRTFKFMEHREFFEARMSLTIQRASDSFAKP